MWIIFKVFIEFVTILLLVYVFMGFFFFFGQEACGILGPRSGMEPLYWRAKSYPLDSQWSPKNLFFKDRYLALTDFWNMDVLLDENLT